MITSFICLFLCTLLPYCLAFRVTERQLVRAKIPRSKVFTKQKQNSASNLSLSYLEIRLSPHQPCFSFSFVFCQTYNCSIVSIPRPRSQGRNCLRRLEAPQCTTSSTCLSSRPTPAPPLSIPRLGKRYCCAPPEAYSSRAHWPRWCVARLVPTRRERSDTGGNAHHSFFSRGAFIQKMRNSV